MAQAEGKGNKIAIGCCSAVAVLVIGGIMATVMLGGKLVDGAKGMMEEQANLGIATQAWKHRLEQVDGNPTAISPKEFAGFTLQEQSDDVAPPGLDLGKKGHLAEYSEGATTLSVWMTEISDLEAEAIGEKIKEQNGDRFSFNSNSSFSNGGTSSMKYTGSPPKERGLLVKSGGWAILLQCNDPDLDLSDLLQKFANENAGAGEDAESATSDQTPGDTN